MAEPMSNTAIVPVAETKGGYDITIKRFSASGAVNPLVVHIPEDAKLATIRDNPLLLAAVLKDGDPIWAQMEPGFVLVAVLHANSLGLDILQGDIYPIEGRLAVSDKAKIRYALQSGLFRDAPEITTVEGSRISIPWETKREKGVFEGPDLTTTVKLHIRGWSQPVVYTASLRTWFKGSNPNWRTNPAGMLELRAYAKACERVCPVGVQPDEAPPLDITKQEVQNNASNVSGRAGSGMRSASAVKVEPPTQQPSGEVSAAKAP